ncbi:MAG: CubicO group peptidase (beta-lactamase class C family), partial [Arenicella sp.]
MHTFKSMRKFYLPKSFIVLISFFALFSCNSDGGNVGNEESETQKIISAFEEKLETDVIEDDIASMSAAIFMDDEIVWSQAFGEANRTTEVIADSSTVYRTASISKTITAYLMMLLVQDGIIKLDDPIKNYLSEIDQIQHNDLSDFTQITFRHLASHTSGLAKEPDLENAASGPIEEWEEKVLNSIPTTHMVSEPGEHFSYSNIGYGILGLALSRAAGEPFMDLVDERVFEPLGMENSFFIISEGEEDNIAAGYSVRAFTGEIESEKAELEHAGRGYKVPNGGIYSTPTDLARF